MEVESKIEDGPKTPFRVVDDGQAFVAEVVFRSSGGGYSVASTLLPFSALKVVESMTEPRPEGWDTLPGPVSQIVIKGGVSEYIRADPEEVGRTWLAYRKAKRLYLSGSNPQPNTFLAMEKPKRVTYLGQVFDRPFFGVVLAILTLALLYTGSLLLFADWQSDYSDPVGSKGNAIGVFVGSAVVIIVAFLVPLFHSEDRRARKAQAEADAALKQ